MTLQPRIAVGSLFTECNHFGGPPIDKAMFARYELRYGREILDCEVGTVGGMLDALRAEPVSVVPLLVASTCPGGPLTAACYAELKGEILRRLEAALPVDGVLLALHGSAAAETAGDLEGDLLAAVRQVVGESLPVVATLDLHAHVTAQMVQHADALVAWETYPHRDAFSTGQRGARLLLRIVQEGLRPAMAMAKVPVVVGAILGHTEGPGPFADVMRFAKSLETHPGVVSTSAFLVHPYLDLPEMGGGGLVITDGDLDLAVRLASQIARLYWDRRFDLCPTVFSPQAAIEQGKNIAGGPVLLVETADCCGGGAAGDAVAALRALLEIPFEGRALAPVVDPVAAAACHAAGMGSHLTLALGHRLDPNWGKPVTVTGTVRALGSGTFTYTGGIWGGQEGNMGPSAVLEVGPVSILVATHGTYDWADEQYRSLGLEASQAKFVVVKNPMNYRLAYAGVAREALILDTPGPTPAVLDNVPFRKLQRPYFPIDREIPGLLPAVHARKTTRLGAA